MRIAAHFFDGPLRVSSLRSLGAFANIFAIESFMDELAEASGQDAIAFRLKHLKDQRAIAVVETVQKQIAGIETDEGEGLGFAFARYKNYSGYCAMAAKVKVDTESGVVRLQQVWAAVDVGEIINPDSLKNQVEGAIVQAAAWTLSEEVTFDEYEITSIDWNTYPIQHFSDAPDLQVTLLDRPDEAAMGGGEVGTPPVAAAICNAIYRAGGQRVRQLPVLIKARSFSKS
jgi:CO/xanthine dehydrogenase Mo-binding subunit